MNAQVIIERGADGTFDANMEFIKEIPFGLMGQGKTVAETIADFYNSYAEMQAMCRAEGKEYPALEFEFKCDVLTTKDKMDILKSRYMEAKTDSEREAVFDEIRAEIDADAKAVVQATLEQLRETNARIDGEMTRKR
ncbi:hypothetical protein [Alistipes senegalensis]|uniref:HicB family protein n=1 Tax=Alistipes senegalensis JC50 TaxID=1033732 RepID=A0ABY5V924_9BACT|nr:hypothetical protein [Alistipes senegalensis]UEA86237.1 hypothetical protein LK406_11045 [Alistipes senegalensis]UWN66176.1 hypothetical protein NQ519_04900 [Alistipes senegalensis JC50]